MPIRVSVDTFQKEALRLFRQQIVLIKEMTTVENLIVSGQGDEEKQSFTKESALDDIEVLDEEIEKLEQLVFVVAVVGTMKAGKSTAINAIAGTEVLPTRNRPMTAVPTLIKHKPDTIDPVLWFENHGPVDDLVQRLRVELEGSQAEFLESEMSSDRHFEDLVNSVRRGGPFKTRYEGADEIAEFLKDFNDLVRLAEALDVDFPFDSYDSVEEMPVIEVEFAHLEAASGTGELCLLDTPGPNESGQPHLQNILREQLTKASAVVAVLDYTQMGSLADAEVRGEIDKIADAMGNRTYVLVNKFDERDRHGDDEAQLRFRVSGDLLKGSVSADHVYPVSAKWAYLANRARNELRKNGRLPSIDATGAQWVADFGAEALGRRWEEEIEDIEEVRTAADELWTDSHLGDFLGEVIRTAHEDAAESAVDSAITKLSVYVQRSADRGTALRMNVNDAMRASDSEIKDLECRARNVEDSKEKARQLAGRMVASAMADLDRIETLTFFPSVQRHLRRTQEEIQRNWDEFWSDDNRQKIATILGDDYAASLFDERERESEDDPMEQENFEEDTDVDQTIKHMLRETIENSSQDVKDDILQLFAEDDPKLVDFISAIDRMLEKDLHGIYVNAKFPEEYLDQDDWEDGREKENEDNRNLLKTAVERNCQEIENSIQEIHDEILKHIGSKRLVRNQHEAHIGRIDYVMRRVKRIQSDVNGLRKDVNS